MSVGRTATRTVLTLILVAIPALAQTTPAESDVLLDELAGLLNRGKLNVEVDLLSGRAAIAPQWTLLVNGTPKATLTAEADEGRIRCLQIDISGGELIVNGSGLRPRLSVEGFRSGEGKGSGDARFRGRGVWRPSVAVFRTLARPALRRLEVPTDIRSILRGQILSAEKSSTPTDTEFLDLVREVHISDTEFEAFAGYPLEFGQLVALQTAAHPKAAAPLRAAIDKATFRPPRRGQPAQFEVDGRIDGEIEDGSVAFLGSHCAFARGILEKGAFRVSAASADGQPEISFSAGSLGLDMSSGQVNWPGGPKIGIAAPSHFDIRNLRVRPDGRYSGTVDAALFGKVGSLERAGTTVAANDVQLHTTGARIVDGKATGDMKLDFQYRLNYTLVVHYPVEELANRSVPLLFQGAFETQLHFEDAGSGDEGLVSGNYQFTIPWPPIEQAAFEILRARWRQDVAPVIHKVDFVIEPRHFGPCGRDCFLLDLVVTAEKAQKKGYL